MYPNFRNFYLDKQAFYSRKIQCNMKRHNKGHSLHGSLDGHKKTFIDFYCKQNNNKKCAHFHQLHLLNSHYH